jgi:hypothetical protein
MTDFIISMTVTSIGMMDFIVSTISTKSSLSATSAFHGGGAGVLGGVGAGVLGGAGTGVTHTDPTDILIIPIRRTTPATDTGMVTMAMVMGRPAMMTDMATRLRVTPAAITAARTKEMTIPPIQEWPSCNADLRRLGITLAP